MLWQDADCFLFSTFVRCIEGVSLRCMFTTCVARGALIGIVGLDTVFRKLRFRGCGFWASRSLAGSAALSSALGIDMQRRGSSYNPHAWVRTSRSQGCGSGRPTQLPSS